LVARDALTPSGIIDVSFASALFVLLQNLFLKDLLLEVPQQLLCQQRHQK